MKLVRCIDNSHGGENWLKVGEVYEVETDNATNYFLRDICKPGGFRRDRFQDVKAGVIDTNRYAAQCIDDYGMDGDITKGVRYVVRQSPDRDEWLVEGVPVCTFHKRRFMLIGLACNETPIVIKPVAKAAAVQDDKSLELSFFKSRASSRECPCGSTRGVCPDHLV